MNINFQKKKELLNWWVAGYRETLKSDLYLGNYRMLRKELKRMEEFEITRRDSMGGEPAAEEMTNYLRAFNYSILLGATFGLCRPYNHQ